jgi:hypothetical protein
MFFGSKDPDPGTRSEDSDMEPKRQGQKKGALLPVLPEGLNNSPEALKPFIKVLVKIKKIVFFYIYLHFILGNETRATPGTLFLNSSASSVPKLLWVFINVWDPSFMFLFHVQTRNHGIPL